MVHMWPDLNRNPMFFAPFAKQTSKTRPPGSTIIGQEHLIICQQASSLRIVSCKEHAGVTIAAGACGNGQAREAATALHPKCVSSRGTTTLFLVVDVAPILLSTPRGCNPSRSPLFPVLIRTSRPPWSCACDSIAR
jgi:hypothetical protein